MSQSRTVKADDAAGTDVMVCPCRLYTIYGNKGRFPLPCDIDILKKAFVMLWVQAGGKPEAFCDGKTMETRWRQALFHQRPAAIGGGAAGPLRIMPQPVSNKAYPVSWMMQGK